MIIIIEMQVLQLALLVEVVAKIEMIDLIIGRTEEAPIIIIIDDVIEIVEDHPTVVPNHENVRRDERGIEEVADVLHHMIVIIIDHVHGRIMDVLRREREDGEEKEEEKEGIAEIVGKGNDHRTILLRIIGGIVVGRMIDMKEKEEMAPGEEGIIVIIVRRRGEGGAVVEIAAVVAEDNRVVVIDTDLAVGIGMAGVVNDRGRAPLIVITVVIIITNVVMICIVWAVAEVVTHSINSLEEGITTTIIKMVGPLEGIIIIIVVAVRKRNVVVGTGIRIVIITITTAVVTIIITIKEEADHPIKEEVDHPINLQRKKVVERRRLQNREV